MATPDAQALPYRVPGAARPGSAALAVRHAVRLRLRERAARRVFVGVSGGADSLALLAGAVAEHPAVTALVVDHGLQAGSAAVATRTAAVARALGARARVLPVTVGAGGGPEDAARRARLTALAGAAWEDAGESDGPAAVLLGHTRDDQAETVLLGLARGSGPRSLAGMEPWSIGPGGVPLGRPLLAVTRAQTRTACAEWGLHPWEDPHNLDPAFTRVRLRCEVLPLLEDVLGGGVAAALARTAELVRADVTELDRQAAQLLDGLGRGDGRSAVQLPVGDVAPLPPALRGRVLRAWLHGRGTGATTAVHIEAVAALLDGSEGAAEAAAPAVPAPAGVLEPGERLVVLARHGTLDLEIRGATGVRRPFAQRAPGPQGEHR